MKDWFLDILASLFRSKDEGGLSLWLRLPVLAVLLYLLVCIPVGMWWSMAPDEVTTESLAASAALDGYAADSALPVGYSTTAALTTSVSTLLNKPGGFLENDRFPPGAWLDNMPNWEFGVIQQARDLALVMRNDMSRSQSQSSEDESLVKAQNKLNIDTESWIFPSAEGEYGDAVEQLEEFLSRLIDPEQPSAQFYARADNLRSWLGFVDKRLGSLSQKLSASVGKAQLNTSLANESAATQSTPSASEEFVKTSWFEIDDIFHQARGASWALLAYMRAAEIDFADVLEKKNAEISLQQIIRELEGTQRTVWSPMIMNGSGFGTFANHSLVMASYISRANAAVIDLRELLEKG